MELIILFKKYFQKHLKEKIIYYWTALLCTFTLNVIAIIPPLLTKTIFDESLLFNNFMQLLFLSIPLLVIYVIESFLFSIYEYYYEYLKNNVNVDCFLKYYHHILKLPQVFFDKKRIGEVMDRLNDSDVIHNIINMFFFDFINNLIKFIIFFGVSLYINWRLTIFLFILTPLYVIIYKKIGSITREYEDERWKKEHLIQSELYESFAGIRYVKVFGAEEKVYKKIKYLNLNYVKYKLSRNKQLIIWENILDLFYSVEHFFLFIIAGSLIITGKMTIGEWLAFQLISSRVIEPLKEMISVIKNIEFNRLALYRLDDLYTQKIKNRLSCSNLYMDIRGPIEFKNVSFSYIEGVRALSKINVLLPENKVIAIIGRSGSGKTTLVSMIAKLYNATSGNILINGIDIQSCDLTHLRKNIGFVLQDSYIAYGSVYDNILFGVGHKRKEEVIKACKIANIHNDILKFPKGYDTLLGDNGFKLSGGQIQRINIAQAIVKDPKILILDEGTSHLDVETESEIYKSMKSLKQDRTIVIIAHRLSTIQNADLIVVLDKGKINEVGTHEDLFAKRGLYYDLLTKESVI